MTKKIKVVLLNHSAEALFGLCKQLERKSFEVLVLAELDDFLDQVKIFTPDIILYDHILPIEETESIFKDIKSNDSTKHSKILLATKNGHAHLHWENIDGTIKKPYTASEVITRINELLS